MPKYKLLYFDARGRAEPARMLFNLKGQEFEDERFAYEDWPKLKQDKKRFPTGQGPVLFVDGAVMPQSKAICRYLAREFGYFGQTNMEGAQIDVVIDTMNDIELKMIPLYVEKDETKRGELVKAFKERTAQPYFSFLVDTIKEGGGKHFVGNKLTLADIVVFSLLDMMTNSKYTLEGVLDPYPELAAFYKAFKEESQLKLYLESRPITEA